jgi:hypothetical protein
MQELAVWKFHDRPQLRPAQERRYTTLPSTRSGQRVTAPVGSAVAEATLFVGFPATIRKWRAGFVGGSVGKRTGGLEMQGKSRDLSGRPIRRNAEDPAKLHPRGITSSVSVTSFCFCHMAQLPVLPVAIDMPLSQTLIKISKAEQPAPCPAVLHLVCLGARLLGAITPMLRIELAGHFVPYAFPIRAPICKRAFFMRASERPSRFAGLRI